MAINLISVRCPECGANLEVEDDREFAFCTYCGTKVMLNNENEHIYRNIDEARIREAETDRMIAMRQLDMEEKSNISRKYLIILWLAATAVLLILGIIGTSIDNFGLTMCMMFGMCVGIWGGSELFGNKKKNKRTYVGSNSAVISETMRYYREKNYNSVAAMFRGAGFSNVTTIPLNDLSRLSQRRNGQVEMITINGESEFEEGDVFPKNSEVLITYHSR